jgi:hypothetical protein
VSAALIAGVMGVTPSPRKLPQSDAATEPSPSRRTWLVPVIPVNVTVTVLVFDAAGKGVTFTEPVVPNLWVQPLAVMSVAPA